MAKADLLKKLWEKKILPNLKSLNLVLFISSLVWLWSCSLESVNNRPTKVEENAMLAGLANGEYGKHGEPYYFEHVFASLENLHLKLVGNSSHVSYENVKMGVQDWLYTTLREDFDRWRVGMHEFRYSSSSSNFEKRGRNLFAHWRAPTTDGTEVMLVTAPLYIPARGYLNAEGIRAKALLKNPMNPHETEELNNFSVAVVMSVMKSISKSRFYSKDVLVVFLDEGAVGSQAFIQEYLMLPHRKERRIKIETVSVEGEMPNGVIQAGVNLELGNHREYAEIGLVAEGLNGQMPNLDLIVAMDRCIYGNFPISIHDHSRYSPESLLDSVLLDPKISLKSHLVQMIDTIQSFWKTGGLYVGKVVWPLIKSLDYMSNILWTLKQQVIGIPTHAHSPLLKYKIDTVTVTGRPLPLEKEGTPAVNMWPIAHLLEDTLRSVSNLIEHLHANNFFYFLPALDRFVSLTQYFPSIGFLFAIMLFRIFEIWSTSFATGDVHFDVSSILTVIAGGYLFSSILFMIPYIIEVNAVVQTGMILSFPLLVYIVKSRIPISQHSMDLLDLWNVLVTAALTSSLSIMNFSLTFVFSLFIVSSIIIRETRFRVLLLITSPILIVSLFCFVDQSMTFSELLGRWLDGWEWYGAWQFPFLCFVCTPFALINALVSSSTTNMVVGSYESSTIVAGTTGGKEKSE